MNLIINPIKNIYLPQQVRQRVSFGLKTDVFEKTTGSTVNDFSIDELKEITECPDNEIGRGFSHIAYNIPKKPDFVLRVPNNFDIRDYENAQINIKDCEDKDLTINVGQKILEIKLTGKRQSATLEILRKQKGTPIGNMPYEAFSVSGLTNYGSKEMQKKFEDSLQKVAAAPISAYEKLIATIQEAGKHNYCFDFLNSNNILYDEQEQSFNVIDLEKGSDIINYGTVLYALVNGSYLKTYNMIGNAAGRKQNSDNITKITDKFMQALENKGLKNKQESCMISFFSLSMGAIFGA